MVALIDADIIAWRSAASAENDSEEIALIRASRTLQDIVSVVDADEIKLFLSGSSNFRYDLYPEYKANRAALPRPKHLQTVREFLVLKWGAEVTDGYEADDAIGICTPAIPTANVVICSIDKDLRQIAGVHYNFVTSVFETIIPLEGWQNFYKQLLIGDVADNVPGIRGIGKVRAAKLIDPCASVYDMYSVVRKLYADDDILLRNGRLIYIWRKENDQWLPPTPVETTSEVKPVTVEKLESMPTMQVESIPSTEVGGTKPKKRGYRVHGQSTASASRKTKRGRSTSTLKV